ncbi:MAG: chromosomal replication initiator protein DnaA [Candidatus Margulisiibacteriota bacterium]
MALTDVMDVWNRILKDLEKDLSKPIYETILSSAKPLTIEDGVLVLAVPSSFSHDWLCEKKCDESILGAVKSIGEYELKNIRFLVVPKEEGTTEEKRGKRILPSAPVFLSIPFLNPRYTFENFVVGHGNRFAQAAALAVSESPGKAYNPLFLYGGVGLGKTHLMQAIGYEVLKRSPKAKVVYVSSEKFTNEVIDSIQHNTMAQFRNKYRNVDVLMIDDIQFIAGKERTMEEFFHTFNTLYETSKQIIISNDRPPKEIQDIEERLRNRFEWGLIADIQPPDFETRIAILKKRAENENIKIPDEVFNTIASKITSNIRELEGALTRLMAHVSIEKTELSPSSVEKILKDIISPSKSKPPMTIETIKKAVAEYFGIKMEELNSKTRTREIATARQVAMYLSRELTSASLPKIGNAFGGRDHTTVMHACDKIKTAIKEDKETSDAVETISSSIQKSGG